MTEPVRLSNPGATVDTLLTTLKNSNLSATHKITRSATVVIAASDSSAKSKAQADYVCDGMADNVEINAAIAALPQIGGKILLHEGTYSIAAPIQIDRHICLEGFGSEITILKLANGANCNVIEFIETFDGDPKALSTIQKIMIDGNRANQTATGLYGIYQNTGNTAIDTRYFDIWFDEIKGGACISLGKYWNHHIEWCTFEHCDGACIETRLSTDSPLSMHIHHNFVTLVDEFMKVSGSGSLSSNCNVTNNIITNVEKNGLQIAGDCFALTDNLFLGKYDADNTYYGILIDTSIYGRSVTDIKIENNIFGIAGTNKAKYFLWIKGTQGVNRLSIRNNEIYQHGGTTGIFAESTGRIDNMFISGNNIDCPGTGISLSNSYRTMITNNIFVHTTTSIACNSNNLNCRIQGNDLGSALTGSLGTAGIISNNLGYVTEKTGSATIAAAATTVNVTHGLAAAPTRVLLSPTTATAGKQYYVSAKAASTFTITIDSAAEADISFDWQAVI